MCQWSAPTPTEWCNDTGSIAGLWNLVGGCSLLSLRTGQGAYSGEGDGAQASSRQGLVFTESTDGWVGAETLMRGYGTGSKPPG